MCDSMNSKVVNRLMTLYEAANPTPATDQEPGSSEIGGAADTLNSASLNVMTSAALKTAPEEVVPSRASRLDSQPELPERSVYLLA